jgi:phosphatidylglycerophosphatase A
MKTSFNARCFLLLAQGGGIGRIPFAPGTFGSILGLGLFLVWLKLGRIDLFLLAVLFVAFASVAPCAIAEKMLGQKDPSSVVLDEIVAVPLCFTYWLHLRAAHGDWPSPGFFFEGSGWIVLLSGFLLFRLFDIWKPWPVWRSQMIKGGVGVVADDLLAAAYVNLVAFAASFIPALAPWF